MKGLQGAIEGEGAGTPSANSTCQGLTGIALTTCQNGGVGGNPTTTKQNLLSIASEFLVSWQEYADANNAWLSGATTTTPILTAIQSICSTVANGAATNLAFIQTNKQFIAREAARAEEAIISVNQIKTTIQGAHTIEKLSDLNDQLNQYNPSDPPSELQGAQNRLAKMRALVIAIGGVSIPITACPETIPSLK